MEYFKGGFFHSLYNETVYSFSLIPQIYRYSKQYGFNKNAVYQPENSNQLVVYLHGIKSGPFVWYKYIQQQQKIYPNVSYYVPYLPEKQNIDETTKETLNYIEEHIKNNENSKIILIGSSNGCRLGVSMLQNLKEKKNVDFYFFSIAGAHGGTKIANLALKTPIKYFYKKNSLEQLSINSEFTNKNIKFLENEELIKKQNQYYFYTKFDFRIYPNTSGVIKNSFSEKIQGAMHSKQNIQYIKRNNQLNKIKNQNIQYELNKIINMQEELKQSFNDMLKSYVDQRIQHNMNSDQNSPLFTKDQKEEIQTGIKKQLVSALMALTVIVVANKFATPYVKTMQTAARLGIRTGLTVIPLMVFNTSSNSSNHIYFDEISRIQQYQKTNDTKDLDPNGQLFKEFSDDINHQRFNPVDK